MQDRALHGVYMSHLARDQIFTPFGISPGLPLRVGYALHFSAVSGRSQGS